MEENKATNELTSEEVKLQINEVLDEIKKKREEIRLASKSGELKRSPFMSLDEKGMLNADSLVSEYDIIQAKKSSLSSGERQLVQQIVWAGLRKAAIKKAAEIAKANGDAQAQDEKPKRKTRKRTKKSENKPSL